MLGRGTVRGVFTAWLALIALGAVAKSDAGSGRIREAFADLDSILQRIKDPTVPGIPDRRTAGGSTGPGGGRTTLPPSGRPYLDAAERSANASRLPTPARYRNIPE